MTVIIASVRDVYLKLYPIYLGTQLVEPTAKEKRLWEGLNTTLTKIGKTRTSRTDL